MKRLFNNLLHRGYLPLLAVFLCLIGGTGQAWAGNVAKIRAISKDPAQGLVYASSKTTAPTSLDSWVAETSEISVDGAAAYIWAMPARGYLWKSWSWETYKDKGDGTTYPGVNSLSCKATNGTDAATGSADKVTGSKSTIQSNYSQGVVAFKTDASYTIGYAKPEGGTYKVTYGYYKVESNKMKSKEEILLLTPDLGEDVTVVYPDGQKSYAADNITLSTDAGNFIEWQEDGVQKSTSKSFNYKATKNATIKALFRKATLGAATGDLSLDAHVLNTPYAQTITIPVSDIVGTWTTGNFVVKFTEKTSNGDLTKNSVNYADGVLTIQYTYTPTAWDNGTEVEVEVTPDYANSVKFTIAASATEVKSYEASVEVNNIEVNNGTLADMMSYANTLDTKPTVKLANNVTISSPLSFKKSMTFDMNSKTLSGTGTALFSVDATGVDVRITDNSFAQKGELNLTRSSATPIAAVVFTKAAQLSQVGGIINVTNTNSADAAALAYGVLVQNGSVFYMTGGKLNVQAVKGANGVYVATATDYATINGGLIDVTANTEAYGIYSVGSTNITDCTMSATTSSSVNAYGVYVNGGTTTLTNVAIVATSKTTDANGAYVNAGRLNVNGGSLAAYAPTQNVYGVQIAKNGTAVLQLRAQVYAEATGVSGKSVYGIQNLGAVRLLNANVTAISPTTGATAVNSATSAVSTTIEEGTYMATAEGGTVYGLHHQFGSLSVEGGTFRGRGNGNSVYGVRAAVDGTINNATISAQTMGSGNTAYGVVAGVANKTLVLKNCSITATSATSTAYAIYSRAIVTAKGCQLNATTQGGATATAFYAEDGTNKLENCTAIANSATTGAYGVNHVKGTMTIDGGTYTVIANQSAASAEQDAAAYGVKNAKTYTTTVKDATFNVSATNNNYSQNAYGAYASGTLQSTNCTYNISLRKSAYGIYGDGTSVLTLSGNKVTVESTLAANSYGIYSNAKFTIDGDNITATSKTTNGYAINFGGSAKGEVLSGWFAASGTSAFGPMTRGAAVGNVELKGGYYKSAANADYYLATGYDLFALENTHPEYAKGYRYMVSNENPSLYVCQIGTTGYRTLEAALQYTLDNSGSNHVIVMTQPYTLPAGDYTLPSNASLLVPYTSTQKTLAAQNVIKRNNIGVIEENLCLTISSGANLNVSGSIEAGGEMFAKEGQASTSYVHSAYGRIHLEEGSIVNLNSSARLYAWGYVTGKGNIFAKGGSKVYEMFQLHDMKGYGSLTQSYLASAQSNNPKIFPINQYFIQNIEAPVTYYYNSELITEMYMYYAGTSSYMGDGEIKLIGTSGALFQITTNDETTWVRKSYDPTKDIQVWDINSSAKLGSLEISVSGVTMNSSEYVLPIGNNMKLHILDGTMEITQSTQFQPGAQLEIDKTANLKVNSGCTVYMIDQSEWGNYASSKPAMKVTYSPSWNKGTCPRGLNLADQADAALNVHGTLTVAGTLRTTASGANIYSNNDDAGTITFTANAPTTETNNANLYFFSGSTATPKNTTAAQLKNATGYTQTVNTESGHSFVYMNNAWVESYVDGCFKVIGETYYANPSEYVALQNGKTANDDHTYTTVGGKTLILQNDCQWWEVEATATPGVFECKKEGYEGFYSYNATAGEWQLVKRTVTFYSDEAGTKKLKDIVTNYMGIPDQSVIATNPTKAQTAAATYQFYGWKSSVTGNNYHWTSKLEAAEENMYYTPVFTEIPKHYTVTFKAAYNGKDIPVETAYNTHPVCDPAPRKDADAQYTYTFLYWLTADGQTQYALDATLPAITGKASYTAVWGQKVNIYTVIFKDGEQTLQTKIDQPYGTATAFAGVLPSKDADDEFEYVFDGWVSSKDGTKYANGSTPAVSGDVTYTAHYATTARYFITFANYDGTVLQKEATTAGVRPVYNGTPRRDADRDGYFRFDGWMDGEGVVYAAGAELPVVSKKQTYTAQWTYVTTRFTVAFENFDGNGGHWEAQFGEGETPSYDGATPLAKASDNAAAYYYEFMGWIPEIAPVTGPATYTAQWSEQIPVKYTITFVYDGYGNSIKKEYAYGANPSYDTSAGDPTPHKDDEGEYSYTFNGWDKAFTTVTGDATYTAQFLQTQHQYTITFVLDNGSANVEKKYNKGVTPSIEDPTKATTAEWSYTFAGWNPAIGPVLYDQTYTAQWNQTGVPYNVTFVDEDGTTILKATEAVAHGMKPVAPANPRKAYDGVNFYSFAGWVSSVDGNTYTTAASIPAVGTSAVTYTAKYNVMSGVVASVTTAGGDVTPYTSFTDALTAAKASADCTLKLYANATTTTNGTTQTISSSMTIDFNGYTLSGSNTGNSGSVTVLTISGGTVIFNDATGNGGISATNSGRTATATAIVVNAGANLTINGGTYYAYNGTTDTNTGRNKYAYTITNNGTLTINDGSFEAKGNTSTKSTIQTINNAQSVSINGGKFAQTGKAATGGNLTTTNSKATLKGGYFTQNLTSANAIIATGYECVNSSEVSGYGYKVQLKKYDIIFKNGDDVLQNTKVEHGSMPEFTGEEPQKDGYTFNGWDNEIVAATANATYTAKWKVNQYTVTFKNGEDVVTGEYDFASDIVAPVDPEKTGYTFAGWYNGENQFVAGTTVPVDGITYEARWTVNQYTITFNSNGGSEVSAITQAYNSLVSAPDAPTKDGYTFSGWSPVVPATMPLDGLTCVAQWTIKDVINTDVTLSEGETEVETITITTDGSFTIPAGAELTVENLIIEANAEESGELKLGESAVLPELANVYFDYHFNGKAFNRAKQNWYAFAVPFEVDATALQYKKSNDEFAPCQLGQAIDIIYYNGQIRAEQGPSANAWEYVEDLGDKTLHPGTLYLAAFSKDEYAKTIRFRFAKRNEEHSYISGTNIEINSYGSDIITDANWNAIANPSLFYSTLNPEDSKVSVGQTYEWSDDEESNYHSQPLSEALSVGKPIFIQTADAVSAVQAGRSSASAPLRVASASKSALYDVRITSEGAAKYSDRLFVKTDEEALDEYTIGADLVKAGVATKRAQMWVANYNHKLCLNTIAPVNNRADWQLGISVPTSGTYIIEQASNNEGTLYLTQNGQVIWNLSMGEYVGNFNAGTVNTYGLRLVIQSPNGATDLEEAAVTNNGVGTQKVIVKDRLLIIRDGQVYDVQGQLLK